MSRAPGLSRRRLALTGAAGRLGQVTRKVLQRDWQVTAVDLAPPAGDPSARPADVTVLDDMRDVLAGHDVVVHLAGAPGPHAGSPDDIYRRNALGTWCVLQAARDQGVRRMLYCSSDYVTGVCGSTFLPPCYLPIDEAHPSRPTEAYGAGKEAAEALCHLAARSWGIEVTVLRPTLILFPADRESAYSRRNSPDNPDVWSYVAPETVAQAFRSAAELNLPGCRTYFVTASRTLSSLPTLDLVRRRFGALPEVRDPELYEREPFAPIFDGRKGRADLKLDADPL